jgi:hypothetical protein
MPESFGLSCFTKLLISAFTKLLISASIDDSTGSDFSSAAADVGVFISFSLRGFGLSHLYPNDICSLVNNLFRILMGLGTLLAVSTTEELDGGGLRREHDAADAALFLRGARGR